MVFGDGGDGSAADVGAEQITGSGTKLSGP